VRYHLCSSHQEGLLNLERLSRSPVSTSSLARLLGRQAVHPGVLERREAPTDRQAVGIPTAEIVYTQVG
jgi:hypothetical protein